MANLHIKRRTKQLDDARPVIIGGNLDNPIWTTKGDIEMSPDDKKQLSANLAAQRKQAEIKQIVDRVLEHFSQFLVFTLAKMAPREIVEAYNGGDDSPWEQWVHAQPIGFHTDGLTATVTFNGKEIASTTAKVDPFLRSDVEAMLAWEKTMAREGLG